MEATKLHNVILDAINEENSLNLDKEITNLIAQIRANQSDQITTTIKSIKERLSGSTFNQYPISNYKILERIKGDTYFGSWAAIEIELILTESSFNIAKLINDLTNYQKKRKEFIQTIKNISDAFDEIGIDVHYYSGDLYELGILFPNKENENNIASITKELNKWDAMCKSISELVGEDVVDTKITLVNNGSLEFFSTNTAHVALCISIALERICTLYKKILEIREARERLKSLGVPETEDKVAKKHEKEIYTKELESIVTDIIKDFAHKKIEAGRLNEIKVAVKGHVTYMAKIVDRGLIIEVNPPEVKEPDILSEEETEDNKKEKKQAEKEYKEKLGRIELIKKSTELTKQIASTGKEIFKFLTSGENSEDGDKDELKK